MHAPCTALPKDIQFSEDGSPITVGPTTSSEERHVAVILSKRVTWNSNFYQVTTMCVYTVLFRYISKLLPQYLVADYEAGVFQEIQRESFTTARQTIHTLSTVPAKDICQESIAKRQKIDSPDILCDLLSHINFYSSLFTY